MKAARHLGKPMLYVIADSLKAAGLRHITGNLVLHPWPFEQEGVGQRWEMGDIESGFAPPVDGFGYNSNVCHLAVLPGPTLGSAPSCVLEPDFAPVHVKCLATTGAPGSVPSITMHVEPEDTSVLIQGEIPMKNAGQYLWVPVQDPALYFGRALRDAMEKQGITVDGEVVVDRSVRAQPAGTPLYTHLSPPLVSVVSVMNKESDNYLAEYVLHALSAHVGGVGRRERGTDAVLNFMARGGIDKHAMVLEDGCGLSRQNLVSARALCRVLEMMAQSPSGEAFKSTLSVGGVDGTLAHRLGGKEFSGRLLGKTGTISRVSSVAGYVTAADGEEFAVAILCNNFKVGFTAVRGAQDRLMEQLILGLR
jgi:serine-type D-Ala-D-Ala carboxypeptidase/endopeptidase (penicillin-binding protein 4)